MTAIISSVENKLAGIARFTGKDRKHSFLSGLLIYTLFFTVYAWITLWPYFETSGTLLGADGVDQYYPLLFKFRRNLLEIFTGLGSGSPVFPMFDPNFSFGSDAFTTVSYDFVIFLPYYIFSVFVPESGLALFYGVGTVLFAYVSGISFIYLCVYFEKNPIAAGFFAPFYVFCGNSFFTAFFNQHFLSMYIAFPLMIVGIDKIIRRKGFKLFVLATAWLALAGIAFLVYTVPFVVLFALIRVYYVYGKSYFKEILPAFARGFGSFILGLCIAGIMLIPALIGLFTGNRLSDSSRIISPEMFIPSLLYLKRSLIPYSMDYETGICAAVIPFVILALAGKRRSSELKCYLLVSILLVSLPVVRYGLNGFSYELCRWGFIPAMLMCFICVAECSSDELYETGSCVKFVILSALYLVLITLKSEHAAVVVLIAAGILTALPHIRKASAFIYGKIKSFVEKDEHVRSIFKAAVVIIISLAVLVSAFLMILTNCRFEIPLIISCCSVPAALLLIRKKNGIRSIITVVLAAALIVTSVMYFQPKAIQMAIPEERSEEEAAIHNAISAYSENDDTFGRIWAEHISDEETTALNISVSYIEPSDAQELNTEKTSVEEAKIHESRVIIKYPDSHLNEALRYGIPDIYIFSSILNSDLISFMRKCGLDASAIASVVNVNGFGFKEVLYSLFGVRYMYAPAKVDRFFGAEFFDVGCDDKKFYPFINQYALPAGVTYSDIMSKERYESFDMATLPYAALNEVYLDGYTESAPSYGKEYSRRCSITHEKISRGAVAEFNECYDNTVTIHDDVSGCFLYVSFENVDVHFGSSYMSMPFVITTDTGIECGGSVHNKDSSWQWKYTSDKYCIPLGYFENDVNTLEFTTPFEYDTLYVTAVPAEVYTDAYNKITAEKAENMTLLPNAMECDVNVSSDKVLCINTMYSKGWKAFVDGEQVPVYKANGLFLGLPLKAGSHSIRLEYTTPWLIEGLILSLVSVAVFIAISIIVKRRRGDK